MNCRTKLFILALGAIVAGVAACRKDHASPPPPKKDPVRRVRYELFTKEDFRGQTENITFRLHMENADTTLFDSALAKMRVEDIPDSLHRIIVERAVPGNDTSMLVVGFLYHIENVGYSWYLDSFPARDTLKVLRYSFR